MPEGGVMNIVILGLSITSSWGNGHATTYRSLVQGLAGRGHRILFLERNTVWYAGNRDTPRPAGARTELYDTVEQLTGLYEPDVRNADLVIVGSFVPDGIEIGQWVKAVARGVTAFYDIDTPVTLEQLSSQECQYVTSDLIASYDLYLSFTGGPTLRRIESEFGAPTARPLYCSVDPHQYRPLKRATRWDLGYLGTYSSDRQPSLEELLLEPARRYREGRFSVAGPMYPETILWPANVDRTIHLSPREHPEFYSSQRFTLNITRDAMKAAGYSPSVRLFEAGACGVPIVSDWWEGLDTIFEPGREILLSSGTEDTLRHLRDISDTRRGLIGERARKRIILEHTPDKRAMQLEQHFAEVRGSRERRASITPSKAVTV